MKTQTAQAETSSDAVGSDVLLMAIEVSLKSWRVAMSDRDGSKVSEANVKAGDWSALEAAIAKGKHKLGLPASGKVLSCYEAGRDGFWVHRLLVGHGVKNLVIDSSSIQVDRRMRRAKTDGLDALQLLELLVRYANRKSGKLRVLRIVTVPSVEQEDARRPHRERERLVVERGGHQSRIKALLALHGIQVKDARTLDVEALRCWDGSPLPREQAAELKREQERLLLADEQIRAIIRERSAHLKSAAKDPKETAGKDAKEVEMTPAQRKGAATAHQLNQLVGIGETSAWLLAFELFWRSYENRRKVAGSTGLCGTPYDSGDGEHDQGISKAGNPLLRKVLVELAWSWLRYQPQSRLARWFQKRFASGGSRTRRIGIVALARRLVVDLWRYVEHGVVPEGAKLRVQKA